MQDNSRVKLSIHFPNTVAMMEWFESVRESGGFGSVPHAEFSDHAWTPREDVGVRQQDSLDESKIKSGNKFIVSGTKDAGRFVELMEGEMMPPHTMIVNKA